MSFGWNSISTSNENQRTRQNKSSNDYAGTLSSWGKTGLSAVGKVTSDGINVINQALVSYLHVECCILNFQQFYFHSQFLKIQLFEKKSCKMYLALSKYRHNL